MTTSIEPASVPLTSGEKAPDFFIVGHPKCGTTALYEMLKAHPQIYMPELKETRFFASELHPGSQAAGLPSTLEEYLSLFAPALPGQLTGEASPSYLRSHAAAARIAALRPDARIIAIFREPASFLRSLHMELVRDHAETEGDLGRALALEADRRRDPELATPGLIYSEYVRYVEQISRYHATFASEQVLVLIYDDFRADNEATLRKVLRFLGVNESSPLNQSKANPSVRVRSPRLYSLVRALYLGQGSLGRPLKAALKSVLPARLRRRGLHAVRRNLLYGQPRPADEQLMSRLRRELSGEVSALGEYLGRDLLTLWGYDRLG